MHPYYPVARRLVGQHVYVHAHGRIHHGILHHVTREGVYLQQMGPRTVSGESSDAVSLAPSTDSDRVDAENVFFPFFFLPWLAIGALGAAAYGGYGGYGWGW